jgi:BirA family biotin operon repressor/biotin-[acetyl-CoA-carboxylase] ligase
MYYFNSKKVYDSCPETLFIGKKILYLPSCHSTNDIAAALEEREAVAEGVVVITDNQTLGRGQRGNQWLSEPGKNLTFSILLKPTFVSIQDQFIISQVVALGISSVLRRYLLSVVIKWPNDIYSGNKKLSGVLIENALQGGRIVKSVIGIGVNINQLSFSHERISSLGLLTDKNYLLQDLLYEFLASIEQFYIQCRKGGYDKLRLEYLKGLLGYNENRLFLDHSGFFRGMVTDVKSNGQIEITCPDGNVNLYGMKELQWVLD